MLTYSNFSLYVFHLVPHIPSHERKKRLPTITPSHIHSDCKWAAFPVSGVWVGSCSLVALCWLIKMPEWPHLVKDSISLFSQECLQSIHRGLCPLHTSLNPPPSSLTKSSYILGNASFTNSASYLISCPFAYLPQGTPIKFSHKNMRHIFLTPTLWRNSPPDPFPSKWEDCSSWDTEQ